MATSAADSTGRAAQEPAGGDEAVDRELDALAREASRLRRDVSLAKAESVRSARALLDVEAQLALADARVAALETVVNGCGETTALLSSRLKRAERVSRAMQSSLSWRITAPLRALKRRL